MIENINKQEIESIADKQGFYICFEESPYKSTDFAPWTLADGEIACICKRCWQPIILSTKDADFTQKLCNLICQDPECEQTPPDYIDRTKSGELIWCADLMRLFWVFHCLDYNELNQYLKDDHRFNLGDRFESETYIAFNSQANDSKNALIFTVYPNADNEWLNKYQLYSLNVKTLLDGNNRNQKATVQLGYPKYFDTLYHAILESIQVAENEKFLPANATSTYDTYFLLNSLFLKTDRGLWLRLRKVVERTKIANDVARDEGKPCILAEIADTRLQRYMDEHRCPVCDEPFCSFDRVCFRCGFDGINIDFLNQQDAEEWRINKLLPFKLPYVLKKVEGDIKELRERMLDDQDD